MNLENLFYGERNNLFFKYLDGNNISNSNTFYLN